MSRLLGSGGDNGHPVGHWESGSGQFARGSDWSSSGSKGGGSEFARLQDALRRRIWLIVLGFVPVFGLTLLYTITAPREFESESTFLLQAEALETSSSSLELLDRLGRVGQIENEVELLKSRRVVAPTVDALDLHVRAEVNGKSRRPGEVLEAFDATPETIAGTYSVATDGDLITRVTDLSTEQVVATARPGDTIAIAGLHFVAAGSPGLEVELSISDFEKGVQQVLGMVTASRIGRDADLIRLKCTTTDPRLARDICESITTSYLELRGELQVTEAANASEFLSDAAEQIRVRLTGAEDSLAEYARQYGAVDIKTRAEEEIRSLAQIRAQRELLQADRDALANYLSQVEGNSLGSTRYRELANFPTFLQNQAVAELVASLIELDNRRSDLSVLRSPENPELAAIDDRIAEIELQLLSLASSYKAALESQISSYDETLQRSSARIATLPRQQIEYLRRQRRVQQLQQVYDMLEVQLREAELAAGVSMPGIRSIDAPQLPLEPSAPSVMQNLLLGAVLGLGFGIFLATFREFTDRRLLRPEQVELTAGAPVIAMLPSLRANMTDLDSQPAVEAFRTLVADLKITRVVGNGGVVRRSLAVTSSAAGEGKSFTACNLAMIWAGMGTRTLLLDADLRAGSVARFFKLPPGQAGFGDVLRGAVQLEDALQTIALKGGGALNVLTAGSRDTDDFVDALHIPGRLAEVFENLEREFDFIILDTPPLNIVSDSTIISAAADSVLFVVRSGKTRPEELDRAMQRIRRVNRDLVGLVLNDIKLPGYYSRYPYADK